MAVVASRREAPHIERREGVNADRLPSRCAMFNDDRLVGLR
jgi:hypothetical protein